MRILIVDDDSATRLCLGKVCSPLGEAVFAETGQEALEAFERALAQGAPFGLVCLDIVMPGLDGQEALQAMRALEKQHQVAPGREAKVMMVTGLGDAGNVCRAFFKGQADGYVTKPLSQQKLARTMGEMGL